MREPSLVELAVTRRAAEQGPQKLCGRCRQSRPPTAEWWRMRPNGAPDVPCLACRSELAAERTTRLGRSPLKAAAYVYAHAKRDSAAEAEARAVLVALVRSTS